MERLKWLVINIKRLLFYFGEERGFTLTEFLVVLFFLTLTGILVYPSFQEAIDRERGKQFLQKFSLDMHEASMMAIAGRTRVDVKFDKGTGRYCVSPWLKSPIAAGQIPKGFSLDHNFPNGGFHFNTSGHISRSGSIYFFYPDGKMKRMILYMDGGVLVIQDG